MTEYKWYCATDHGENIGALPCCAGARKLYVVTCPRCTMRRRMEQVDDSWGPDFTVYCGPCHMHLMITELCTLRAEVLRDAREALTLLRGEWYAGSERTLEGLIKKVSDAV